jgi:TolA-binding protein
MNGDQNRTPDTFYWYILLVAALASATLFVLGGTVEGFPSWLTPDVTVVMLFFVIMGITSPRRLVRQQETERKAWEEKLEQLRFHNNQLQSQLEKMAQDAERARQRSEDENRILRRAIDELTAELRGKAVTPALRD